MGIFSGSGVSPPESLRVCAVEDLARHTAPCAVGGTRNPLRQLADGFFVFFLCTQYVTVARLDVEAGDRLCALLFDVIKYYSV